MNSVICKFGVSLVGFNCYMENFISSWRIALKLTLINFKSQLLSCWNSFINVADKLSTKHDLNISIVKKVVVGNFYAAGKQVIEKKDLCVNFAIRVADVFQRVRAFRTIKRFWSRAGRACWASRTCFAFGTFIARNERAEYDQENQKNKQKQYKAPNKHRAFPQNFKLRLHIIQPFAKHLKNEVFRWQAL